MSALGICTRQLPASPAQTGFWLFDEIAQDPRGLNLSLAFEIHGELRIGDLRRAVQGLVDRHEALRTTFEYQAGELRQIVWASVEVCVALRSAVRPGAADPQSSVQAFVEAVSDYEFDLGRPPLLRVEVLELDADSWILVLVVHHIAADWWSLRIILRDLSRLYGVGSLMPLERQYSAFAELQRSWLRTPAAGAQRKYWDHRLTDLAQGHDLRSGITRSEGLRTWRAEMLPFRLEGHVASRVSQVSSDLRVTPFMLLACAVARLIHAQGGADDVRLATPVAGRREPWMEDVVGPFVNTVLIRVDMSDDPPLVDLAAQIKRVAIEALDNQDLPFTEVNTIARRTGASTHSPVCQAMLAVEPSGGLRLSLPGCDARELPGRRWRSSELDLTVVARLGSSELGGELEYASDVITADDAETISARLVSEIETTVSSRTVNAVRGHRSEDGSEARTFVGRRVTRDSDMSVNDLVATTAGRHPTRVAVESDCGRITYDELLRRAQGVASYLRGVGVGPDVLVGIWAESSVDTLTSMLGVLLSGGAYLPLDPQYPAERLRYMVKDADPLCVLTAGEGGILPDVPSVGMKELRSTGPCNDLLGQAPSGSNLAYVIYTSGSTGQPKGIMMPHSPLTNLLQWQARRSPSGRTLQFAPLSFDVSFQEIFSTWIVGGTIVLLPEGVRRDLVTVARVLREASIDRLFVTPSALHELARVSLELEMVPTSLREVITAGEQLVITEEIAEWCERQHGVTLDNQYGPAETHVVTAYRMEGPPRSWPRVPPIGSPIANTEIQLATDGSFDDAADDLAEVLVGGDAVSRGYLGRPAETARRFVPNPQSPGSRLYRTGDLARSRGGTLRFAGRADDQVKIRGYRVELREVEQALHECPEVSEAGVGIEAVGGRHRLVGAYTSDRPVDPVIVLKYIRQRLPAQMVPSRIAQVSALPHTSSGKLDRRAIVAMVTAQKRHRRPAGGSAEDRVAAIWRDILEVEHVEGDDDFFALGGDSLMATQLVARLAHEFGLRFSVGIAFERPTLTEQAAVMREGAQRGTNTS